MGDEWQTGDQARYEQCEVDVEERESRLLETEAALAHAQGRAREEHEEGSDESRAYPAERDAALRENVEEAVDESRELVEKSEAIVSSSDVAKQHAEIIKDQKRQQRDVTDPTDQPNTSDDQGRGENNTEQ